MSNGHELADARLRGEDEAKKALSELEKIGVDSEEFETKMRSFVTSLRDHAQHEEQEIFPALRRHLDAGALAKLRSGLVAVEGGADAPELAASPRLDPPAKHTASAACAVAL